MAAKKKIIAAENVETAEAAKNVDKNEEQNVLDINVKFEGKDGRLTLTDVAEIVNAVVDLVFIERNGKIEFAAEYYEVLLAYFQIGAFYPSTGVLDNGVGLFFMDYIDNKYHKELGELKYNNLAKYIENAVTKKIEAKMRQIENPLINSLTKLVDTANILAQKYVDDIDNVGSSDIKKFIEDFADFAKKTNTDTITDAVIKLHQKEAASVEKSKPAAKKQNARTKKLNA